MAVLLVGIILVYVSIWEKWIAYNPILSYFGQLPLFLTLLLGLMPFGILGLISISVLGKSDLSSDFCSCQEIYIIPKRKSSPSSPKAGNQTSLYKYVPICWVLV